MYKYEKGELKEIFASFTPTELKKEELLEQILKKSSGEQNEYSPPFRRLRPAFILAVLLVALTTITALAVSLGWNEVFIEYLKPTEKQMQELDGGISDPLASVSQNGVTIEIKQTIADRQGVYILYDLTAPDWVGLNDNTRFDLRRLNLPGGSSEKIVEQSKNKRTVMIYSPVDGDELPQSLQLEFGDLGYFDSAYQFHTLIEGSWAFEFELNHLDATKTIEVNQKVDINGTNDNTITNLYVSPISILINIEGDDLWTAIQPVITFQNGEEIKIEAVNDFNTSYSFHNAAEKGTLNEDGSVRKYGVYSISRRFDRLTDVSEIKSVTIGNVTIPIS